LLATVDLYQCATRMTALPHPRSRRERLGVVMVLNRDKVVVGEASPIAVLPPALNAARGIVIAAVLSAVLWSLIGSIIWLLAP
jgi:hypothetical protein